MAALFVLPGCAAPGPGTDSSCPSADEASLNSPHPKNQAPAYAGTGKFRITPESPEITSPENLHVELEFTNPDQCTFFYRDFAGNCGNRVVRIGKEPFFLYGVDKNLTLAAPVPQSCGIIANKKWKPVAPGETYRASFDWDGAFELWNHTSVEAGGNWTQQTYWAAPGKWTIEYGFDRFTSYTVGGRTEIDVQETDLNRGSPVHPDRCSVLRGPTGRFADVNITLSQPSATIGTPVTVELTYTLIVPAPGCYIFAGEPQVEWSQGLERRHSLGGRCAGTHNEADPFIVLVQTSSTSIPVRLSYAWDGSGAEEAGCRWAASGNTSQFAFLEPVSMGGAREVAVTPFEWVKP